MDEIESKLLKEIEYFALHPERIGYNISIVNQLKAKLEQHQATKKWVEGLIDKYKELHWEMKEIDEGIKYAIDRACEELKKQISGKNA